MTSNDSKQKIKKIRLKQQHRRIKKLLKFYKFMPKLKKGTFSLSWFLGIIILVDVSLYFALPYLGSISVNVLFLISFLALFFPLIKEEKKRKPVVNWRFFISGWILYIGSFYLPWTSSFGKINNLKVANHSFVLSPLFLICNIWIFFSLEFATIFRKRSLDYAKTLLLIGYLLWFLFFSFLFARPFILRNGYLTWVLSFGVISFALSWETAKNNPLLGLIGISHILLVLFSIFYISFLL